jgi:hypothetical protein
MTGMDRDLNRRSCGNGVAMNDSEVLQCLAVIEEIYDDEAKVAGVFDGIAAFRKIIEWLRANGINLGVILSNLTAIITILKSSDDWLTKIEKLIAIFFPSGEFTIAAPAE